MTKDTREADVAFIRALAEVLDDNDRVEIDVKRDYGEDDSLRVRVSRRQDTGAGSAPLATYLQAPQMTSPVPSTPATPATPTAQSSDAAAAAPASDDPAQHPGAVTSPMVGTAYLSPEPGAAAFVSVGDKVSEGQTLMIIEAMKTMNQIPSPRGGTVKRILVEDGAPVEYGAPLMIVE